MDPWLLVSLAGGTCLASVALGAVAIVVVMRLRLRAAGRARDRALEDQVREAASALSFEEVSPHVYEGRVRGRRVRWTLREVDHEVSPRLQLAFGTQAASGELAVTHRSMVYGGAELEPADMPLVRLGDPAFDVRFHIQADLEHLSLLQAPIRQIVLDASAGAQMRIRNGWIWLDHNATSHLVESATSRMEALMEAASVFDQVHVEVEQRVRRLSQDPVAKVRLNVLELLAARGTSEFTGWIAKALLDDPEPIVRVRAAEFLSDIERLKAIATNAGLPRDARRMAAVCVSAVGTPAQRIDLANALVRMPLPARGSPSAGLSDVSLDLVTGHEASAESVIIELVQSPDASIARRAVVILAEIGSARSLVILQALVDTDTLPTLLRLEARKALETLRSRPFRRTPLPVLQRTAVPVQRFLATPLHGIKVALASKAGGHDGVALDPLASPAGHLGSQLRPSRS